MTQENAAANYFATWFSTLDWVPFNDSIAAYVSEYTTQKHGPAVVFMIAPFLLLLGPTTTSALVGNILLISIVPVIGYYTFRLYFSELISRLVAALIAIGPGLFMWTRHASPVPYDSFTALFVAGATYLLLRGVRSDRRRYYLAAGVVLSLAALTKLTALVVWLPFVLIVFRGTPNVMTAVQRTAETVSAWFIIPITFLLAGYNFIAQYLYTVYKLTLYKVQKESGGSVGGQAINDPAAALDDPVIGLLGTLYNIRWMNLALCLLGVVFVLLVIWDRSRLERIEYLIAAAMVTAFLPFGIWVLFSAGTLSRHTIMLSVPLGFIGCVGISMLKSYSPNVDHTRLVRFGQAALLISATQLVINI